jgi:hypothetical protein
MISHAMNNNNSLQTCIAPTDNTLTHSHACCAFPMLLMTQSLCEAIPCHILCRNVLHPNYIVLDCITDKVVSSIDMFRSDVRDRILG